MSAAAGRRALEAAYRRAHYVVLLSRGELVLSIDLHDAEADRRLALEAGCRDSWAIVTPCNPHSVPTPEVRNRRALEHLRQELVALGAPWVASVNRDPLGKWPEEAGCCLLDPDLAWAVELGRRYRQNAVVTGRLGDAPRVVWLDQPDAGEAGT